MTSFDEVLKQIPRAERGLDPPDSDYKGFIDSNSASKTKESSYEHVQSTERISSMQIASVRNGAFWDCNKAAG